MTRESLFVFKIGEHFLEKFFLGADLLVVRSCSLDSLECRRLIRVRLAVAYDGVMDRDPNVWATIYIQPSLDHVNRSLWSHVPELKHAVLQTLVYSPTIDAHS